MAEPMMGALTQTAQPVPNPAEDSLVKTASGGNPMLAQLTQNMLNRDQRQQEYLTKTQEAYNTDLQKYAQMVEQSRSPEANDAQMWGSIASAASSVRPEYGSLGQMMGRIGGAYGEQQGAQRDRDVKNQGDLTKLRQAEVRALEAKDQNTAMARAMGGMGKGGMPVIKVVGGKLVEYDPLTRQVSALTGSNEQQEATLYQMYYKAAVKNEIPDPEEYARSQTKNYMSQIGGTTVKGQANNIPGIKSSVYPAGQEPGNPPAPAQEIVTDNAEQPSLKFDVSGLSPEDKSMVQRLIARYQANPNEGTKAQTARAIDALMQSGSIKQSPQAQTVTTPNALTYPDKPKKEGAIESSKEGAKMYGETFKTDVLQPAQAFQDTGRIMQDFNRLGEMQNALKNGKLKEFMAGESGKWALSVLPDNSDLRKGIANAQEAEKLTSGMVNKILMASKGVQTEGDANRARSQVTAIGADPDANKYLEAYTQETARQLKLREKSGLEHKKATGNWEGYDDAWQNSPIMKDARGSVKKFGNTWVGLTQYINKFNAKNPGATVEDAVASWNKVK